MIRKIILLVLFLQLCSNIYSQELYIVSHPAASISRNRIEIRNIVMGYDNFNYTHNSFDINYGILGNLTLYNGIFYTPNNGYSFVGNYEGALRYRFHDIDKKNYHLRFAFQTGALIPVNSKPIVGNAVEYELHPGHVVSFYNFLNNITVPSIDFHTTDNYTLKNDFIVTNLIDKFSVTGEMGYNVNIPKNDFKFGNYFDWSLAMGYLLIPRQYKSYDDVNVNLYSESKFYYFYKNELAGEKIAFSGGFRCDTYIGIQAIFLSSLMIEGSYKIPVYSNEYAETRIGKRSTALLFSIRYLFFL